VFHLIRSDELPASQTRTVEFQGEPYGAGISFLLVDNEPGQGPDLHRHPYAETWVVRSGRGRHTGSASSARIACRSSASTRRDA
jgi:quercetin dioxygenase-like cupin family protein